MKYRILTILLLNFTLFAQESTITKIDTVTAKNGYCIDQIYPNPFGSINYIDFNIPYHSNVKIFILTYYSTADSELILNTNDTLKIIYSGELPVGYYRSTWDLLDTTNTIIKSGYYCFCITAKSLSGIKEENALIMEFSAKNKFIVLK